MVSKSLKQIVKTRTSKKKTIKSKSTQNRMYPIDYITYKKNGKLPDEVPISQVLTKKNGFYILPLTPDEYKVPSEVSAYHAGFKHMKEITMPKIKKYRETHPDMKGFFIAEGDLCLNKDYTFEHFIKDNYKKPTWLGYKKKLSNYIVGNFLLYFPAKDIDKLDEYFQNKKILVYSDRFFTNLVEDGFIKLRKKSIADEIEHYSSVIKNVRESKCHLDKRNNNNNKSKNKPTE